MLDGGLQGSGECGRMSVQESGWLTGFCRPALPRLQDLQVQVIALR
jgi:hypothetical protein